MPERFLSPTLPQKHRAETVLVPAPLGNSALVHSNFHRRAHSSLCDFALCLRLHCEFALQTALREPNRQQVISTVVAQKHQVALRSHCKVPRRTHHQSHPNTRLGASEDEVVVRLSRHTIVPGREDLVIRRKGKRNDRLRSGLCIHTARTHRAQRYCDSYCEKCDLVFQLIYYLGNRGSEIHVFTLLFF